MAEIEITREDYERLWGHIPPGDAVGVAMHDDSGRILAYYKFVGKTHEEIPSEGRQKAIYIGAPKSVAPLRRSLALFLRWMRPAD